MIEIWIAAAIGIASSAPRTPNSVEPNSTDVSTTNGCTWTALRLDARLDDVVLDLLVDDRPDHPDDRRRCGKSLKSVMMPDEDRAERRADERHEVEQEDHHRERAGVGHAEDQQHDVGEHAGDQRLAERAGDVVADRVADPVEQPLRATPRAPGPGARRASPARCGRSRS